MEFFRKNSILTGIFLLVAGHLLYLGFPGRLVLHIPLFVLGGIVLAYGIYQSYHQVGEVMQGKGFRAIASAVVYSLVVFGVWGLINYLGIRHDARFDFTAEKIFTLDERTIQELRRVDREIETLAFVSDSNEQVRDRVRSLFEEFRRHTDRVSYRFVDPFKNPGEVEKYGISEEGTLIFVSGDRREKVVGFDHEKITNAINKIRRDVRKVVYFTTGHGERAIDDFEGPGTSEIRDALQNLQYEVKSINLLQGSGVPADATVLVVARPEAAFLDAEVDMIRDWLEGGGSLFVLLDPGPPHGLGTLLAEYGLRVNDDRVINVNPISSLLGFDANVPLGTEYTGHPVVEELGVTTFFPVAASVELIEEGTDPEVETDYLVRTDSQSWGETDPDEIRSGRVQRDDADRPGPVPLGAAATAPVRPPEPPAGAEEAGEPERAGEEAAGGERARLRRVILFGDSSFASNQFVNLQGNRDLVLNSFEWLAEGEESISIPPRRPQSRTILLNRGQARMIFYATIFDLPGIFVVIGFTVWIRRRNL